MVHHLCLKIGVLFAKLQFVLARRHNHIGYVDMPEAPVLIGFPLIGSNQIFVLRLDQSYVLLITLHELHSVVETMLIFFREAFDDQQLCLVIIAQQLLQSQIMLGQDFVYHRAGVIWLNFLLYLVQEYWIILIRHIVLFYLLHKNFILFQQILLLALLL